MSYRRTTEPASESLTNVEVKPAVLARDAAYTHDDSEIDRLIVQAREYAEQYTGRAFVSQVWTLYLDSFPRVIELPVAPVISLDSIKYLDDDGNQQTVDPALYRLLQGGILGKVEQAYNQTWPSTRAVSEAVEVEFTAGYVDGADADTVAVPEGIRGAMLSLIAHWYQNKEATSSDSINAVPFSVKAQLDQYRIPRL